MQGNIHFALLAARQQVEDAESGAQHGGLVDARSGIIGSQAHEVARAVAVMHEPSELHVLSTEAVDQAGVSW